jgi:hypothetical protein
VARISSQAPLKDSAEPPQTTLLDDGHQVIVHDGDTNRAAALVDRGAALVVRDLASAQSGTPGAGGQHPRPTQLRCMLPSTDQHGPPV